MSCETFKTTMGGVEYNYTQLPASKSLRLKIRIAKVFAEALPMLINGVGKSDAEQLQVLAGAINTVLSNTTSDEVTDLILDTVRTVQIGNDQIDVDKQFSGDLATLYTLLYWVLKKEYGSFLDAATDLFEYKQVAPMKKAGSQNISQI